MAFSVEFFFCITGCNWTEKLRNKKACDLIFSNFIYHISVWSLVWLVKFHHIDFTVKLVCKEETKMIADFLFLNSSLLQMLIFLFISYNVI